MVLIIIYIYISFIIIIKVVTMAHGTFEVYDEDNTNIDHTYTLIS